MTERSDKAPVEWSRLSSLLNYDPVSGLFTWRVRVNNNRGSAGAQAGSTMAIGYRTIAIDGRPYLAHRLAWFYVHRVWPPAQIDHIDGCRANNAIANLRLAVPGENAQNQRRPLSSGSSGFLGVTWDKVNRLWRAKIKINRRSICLGRFKLPEQAHAAYIKAKREIHPFGML